MRADVATRYFASEPNAATATRAAGRQRHQRIIAATPPFRAPSFYHKLSPVADMPRETTPVSPRLLTQPVTRAGHIGRRHF